MPGDEFARGTSNTTFLTEQSAQIRSGSPQSSAHFPTPSSTVAPARGTESRAHTQRQTACQTAKSSGCLRLQNVPPARQPPVQPATQHSPGPLRTARQAALQSCQLLPDQQILRLRRKLLRSLAPPASQGPEAVR